MPLLVTGSIGIDTVDTPSSSAVDVLGGSAIYFSLAASLFGEVRLVGVVGDDFDHALLAPLEDRRIDLRGLETRAGSSTFRWHGKYLENMNDRETVEVQLNVLAEAGPQIPDAFLDSRYVFLANTHPALQRELAERLTRPELIVCDTMDLWIANEAEELKRLLSSVHGLVLNEDEARIMSDKLNLVAIGREILQLGPKFVVIKQGEYGSLLVDEGQVFIMPAYPTEKVTDPTGCGDAFAGGMMGHLAAKGRWDADTLRAAIARGSVVASFVVESFSTEALQRADVEQVEERLRELIEMSRFT